MQLLRRQGPQRLHPHWLGVGERRGWPPALAAEMQPGPSPIHALAAGVGRGEVPAEAGGWLGTSVPCVSQSTWDAGASADMLLIGEEK